MNNNSKPPPDGVIEIGPHKIRNPLGHIVRGAGVSGHDPQTQSEALPAVRARGWARAHD